jgi:hypothetical protein
LLLAAASTIVVGNADLPARRLLEAHMDWAIQSVAGDSSADVMRITGRSSVHKQWSFDQTLGAAASFGGEPDQLPDGVDVDLRVIEFDWRGSTLRLTRDSESSPWVNDRGVVFDTSAVLTRLNAPENFGEYVHALLTMDWFDGQLNAYYRSVAFHRPGEYGPGTENPFERKRQPFHLTGIGWGWDAQTIGLYVAWALIWIVAVATIGLCFWVDRRKPSRKKTEATLPA